VEESVYEAVPLEGCGMGRLGPGCVAGRPFFAAVGAVLPALGCVPDPRRRYRFRRVPVGGVSKAPMWSVHRLSPRAVEAMGCEVYARGEVS